MSEWISIQKTRPPVGQVLAWLRDGTYQVYHVYHGDHVFPEIVAWQPLPPPPPRESSFEKFWDGLGSWKNKLGSEWTDEFGSMPVNKEAARKIWNLAAEAARAPDFVP